MVRIGSSAQGLKVGNEQRSGKKEAERRGKSRKTKREIAQNKATMRVGPKHSYKMREREKWKLGGGNEGEGEETGGRGRPTLSFFLVSAQTARRPPRVNFIGVEVDVSHRNECLL